MRKPINHTTLCAAVLLPALSLAFSSCLQEASHPVAEPITRSVAPDEAVLRFSVGTPSVPGTKSVITEDHFETGIRSILLLVMGEDGSWKTVYREASSGYLSTGAGNAVLTLDEVTVKALTQRYDVYAFVNMGNVMGAMPSDAAGRPLPEAFVYALPASYAGLNTSGLPMCSRSTLMAGSVVPYGSGGAVNLTLTLRRLMAKVILSVNKSGMTGENADVLRSGAVRVRQVPRVLRPFATGGSRALDSGELYGGASASTTETDYYVFSAEAGATSHASITLYVPENCQGMGIGTSQQEKTPASGPGALATYLEYTASKNAASDGVGGSLTYKAYLGGNETDDFNVVGDRVYDARLSLSWNGLFYDGDWRIDNSGISDGRVLTLSPSPHTSSTSFSNLGHLRRNQATSLYVNFSRDGGTTWVHSAKDIDAWPYGWDLYVDGVKQPGGATGAITSSDLAWSYTGASAGDRLAITPGPASVTASTHTLQVKSVDGRVASNVVSFDISQPLRLQWGSIYGADKYVAQCAQMTVGDKESSGLTITYADKNATGKLRFTDGSENGVTIGFLASGEYTVVATASNGQTGEFTFSVSDPTVRQLRTLLSLQVDGEDSDALLRYETAGGTEMTVAGADYMGYGTRFAPSLYETCLKPSIVSISPTGGYTFNYKLRNLVELNDKRMYVGTLQINTAGKQIKVADWLDEHFKVSVKAGTEELAYETYFKNPFADVDKNDLNATLHDVSTLYGHLNASQWNNLNRSIPFTFSTSSSGRLYASPANVLVQTSTTLGDYLDALSGTYTSGRNTISLSFSTANNQEHSIGRKSVYLHVRNRHDVTAGGGRQKYSIAKQIGSANIYLHVGWATYVCDRSANLPSFLSTSYSKRNAGDTWEVVALGGGFVGNGAMLIRNEEVAKLVRTFSNGDLSGAFFLTARTSNQGFVTAGTNSWKLNDGYGFIGVNTSRQSQFASAMIHSFRPGEGIFPLGYAVLRTAIQPFVTGDTGGTMTWNQWKAYEYTSPFMRWRSMYEYTEDVWSGSPKGYHFKQTSAPLSPADGSGKGFLIVHYLQDLPVNANGGYIE